MEFSIFVKFAEDLSGEFLGPPPLVAKSQEHNTGGGSKKGGFFPKCSPPPAAKEHYSKELPIDDEVLIWSSKMKVISTLAHRVF